MKKLSTYIVILIIGFLLGGISIGIFTNKDSETLENTNNEASVTWTCSMHPQIKQPQQGKCPICGMDLVLLEGDSSATNPNQFQLTERALALANIQTTVVGSTKASNDIIKLSGKISENEETTAVQVSYFSGRIENLYINTIGERVKKGQILATIYAPELISAQQELLTASSIKNTQPKLYQAVKNKLKLWKLSSKQITKIEESKQIIEFFPIYATVSGTVSQKLMVQGASVKKGQALFKVSNLNSVWALFDVYEHQISQFKIGQHILVSTIANPNKVYKKKIDFIDPSVSSESRTLTLRVVLENSNQAFKTGMFVEGSVKPFVEKTNLQRLLIPTSAVLWTGEKSVVYLKPQPELPIFEMKEVSLGSQLGDYYEVISGIQRGDEIVTNGTFTIDAAAQLQGKKSMMNKKGTLPLTAHITKSDSINYRSKEKIPKPFKDHLNRVFDNYIQLKDALVNEDSINARKFAKMIFKDLKKVTPETLKDSVVKAQWEPLQNEILQTSQAIINTTKIKTQRHYFKQISVHFLDLVKHYGVNEKVYSQYCPMADNNKGAYWLSKEEKILNPYFGNAMLHCGTVKQIIE